MQVQGGDLAQHLATVEEIGTALDELTVADLVRIRRAAVYYRTRLQEPDDLINETVRRLLDTSDPKRKRNWPRDVPFVRCFINIMKSLAQDSRRQVAAARRRTDGDSDPEEQCDAPGGQPADLLARREEVEEAKKRRDEIWALFDDSPNVQSVLLGIEMDLSAEETRTELELTTTEYGSARRKLRRRLDKSYPKGLQT